MKEFALYVTMGTIAVFVFMTLVILWLNLMDHWELLIV